MQLPVSWLPGLAEIAGPLEHKAFAGAGAVEGNTLPREMDQWLERIGLGKYSSLFAEQELDIEILPDVTERDLKDLEIPLGDCKRLMRAIAAISPGATPCPSAIESDRPAERGYAEAERRQSCFAIWWVGLRFPLASIRKIYVR